MAAAAPAPAAADTPAMIARVVFDMTQGKYRGVLAVSGYGGEKGNLEYLLILFNNTFEWSGVKSARRVRRTRRSEMVIANR